MALRNWQLSKCEFVYHQFDAADSFCGCSCRHIRVCVRCRYCVFWVTFVQRGVRVCDVSDSVLKPISHIRSMDYVWLIWYIDEVINIYLDIYFFGCCTSPFRQNCPRLCMYFLHGFWFASCCAHHQKTTTKYGLSPCEIA